MVVSYAQNFEDVLLNRVFSGKTTGFYIDVGAAHPELLSVTKWFYDLGWRGINIEPIPEYCQALRKARPRDINLQVALGAENGIREFYESALREGSSFSKDIARDASKHAAVEVSRSGLVKHYPVKITTLADVCREHCPGAVDFLKVDVEGFERDVLKGADFSMVRPRIIVVEATTPHAAMKPEQIWGEVRADEWEDILLSQGYCRVHFDGMNCFYCQDDDVEAKNAFSIPVNTYEVTLPTYEDISDDASLLLPDLHLGGWRHAKAERSAKESAKRYAVAEARYLSVTSALKEKLFRKSSGRLARLLWGGVKSKALTHSLEGLSDWIAGMFMSSEDDVLKRTPEQQRRRFAEMASREPGTWLSLKNRMAEGRKLRVVFVNDQGFDYGAGIASRRQASSFLAYGHEVVVVCASKDAPANSLRERFGQYDSWVGMISLYAKALEHRGDGQGLAKETAQVVADLGPDLVIAGNFHASQQLVPGSCWNELILEEIDRRGIPVVTYVHDSSWQTGGCAVPQLYSCDRFLSGCDACSCPKPSREYPSTGTELMERWRRRSRLFSGKDPVPMATNSQWMLKSIRDRYPDGLADVVRLGLDTNIYQPDDKRACRRKLGLDPDAFYLVIGSDSFDRKEKGGSFCRDVLERIRDDESIKVISFGRAGSLGLGETVRDFGYIEEHGKLVDIYRAADVYLNPVTMDSFGQTAMESLACGVPNIVFPCCGVVEIARNGENAIHIPVGDVGAALDAIRRLRDDTDLRARLGRRACQIVRREFSLESQYRNWSEYLLAMAEQKAQRVKPGSAPIDPENGSLASCWVKPEDEAVATRRQVVSDHRGKCLEDRWAERAGDFAACGGLRTRGFVPKDEAGDPLVTVATVTLNAADDLEKTLLSVFGQEQANVEILVIDGGSADRTPSLLNRYDDLIDLWVSEPDEGVYHGMNKAASLARGDYICFINSGDYFTTPLATASVFNGAREGDVLYGNVIWISPEGVEQVARAADFEDRWHRMVRGEFGHGERSWLAGLPPHQSVFMRTDILRRHGFDVSKTISADMDLLMRVRADGGRFVNHGQLTAVYPGGGLSHRMADRWIQDLWDTASRHSHASQETVDAYFEPIYRVYAERVMESQTR